MNIEEVTEAIKNYSGIVNDNMDKPLGDAGHKIVGLLVVPRSGGKYDLFVLGEDTRSGVPLIRKPLQDWLRDSSN